MSNYVYVTVQTYRMAQPNCYMFTNSRKGNIMQKLRQQLSSINRKSYPSYKSLRGSYNFRSYTLCIDHVQGDPFASPSNLSVKIPLKASGFPADYFNRYDKRIALQDFLRNWTLQFQSQRFREERINLHQPLRTGNFGAYRLWIYKGQYYCAFRGGISRKRKNHQLSWAWENFIWFSPKMRGGSILL